MQKKNQKQSVADTYRMMTQFGAPVTINYAMLTSFDRAIARGVLLDEGYERVSKTDKDERWERNV